jgi:dTDP-4-dehydrorhamnose reductase
MVYGKPELVGASSKYPMNILGTGLSGLIGTRVCQLLSSYTFQNLSLETGVDITDPKTVDEYFSKSDAQWVFHFAAKTDVDGAEKERHLGVKSSSYIVNVLATKHIVDACRKTGKKLLYVSTDFVFDGTKSLYTEADTPNPLGWYAQTKYEGEKLVSGSPRSLIIRIANPYGAASDIRPDFVHKIITRLASGGDVTAPSDQIFIPTFIDDIARAIGKLIAADARGIYHVVGTGPLTPL